MRASGESRTITSSLDSDARRAALPARSAVHDGFVAALDMVGEAVLVFRTDSLEIVAANRAARRLTTLPRRRLIGESILRWGEALFGNDFAAHLNERACPETGAGSSSHVVYQYAGQPYEVELQSLSPRDDGAALAVVVIRAQLRPADAEAEHCIVRRDALTGLADRAALQHRAELVVAQGQDGDRWCALYFLDVDDFKAVNDRFGHLVGDGVLRAVAGRLAACVRPNDLVVRYGGDEFVMLVSGIEHPSEADRIASRIAAALAPEVVVADRKIEASVSVGVALARQASLDLEALLENADRSMYRAKLRRCGRQPR